MVNCIYSQVGIRFELQGNVEIIPNSSQYWTLNAEEYVWEWTWSLIPFQRKIVATQQSLSLMSHYTAGDCVEIYFAGEILSGPRKPMAAFRHPHGIVFSRKANAISLAHELGHALGLKDCYDYLPPPHEEEDMSGLNIPIACGRFASPFDWGRESGVGFYSSFDTHSSVMRQLLMYGRMAFVPELSGYDIPDGEFEGLSTSSADSDDKKSVRVGASNIEPVDGKVYSK